MTIRLWATLVFTILVINPLQARNGSGYVAALENETFLFVIQAKEGYSTEDKTLKLCDLNSQVLYFNEIGAPKRKAGVISLEKMLSIIETARSDVSLGEILSDLATKKSDMKRSLAMNLLILGKPNQNFSIPITVNDLNFDSKRDCLTLEIEYMGDTKLPSGTWGETLLFTDLTVARDLMTFGSVPAGPRE